MNSPAKFQRVIVSVFIFIMFQAIDGWTADLERGKVLHDEHCQACHQSDVYTRPERMVENLPGLKQRVSQCELGNSLLWFDEEIEDVSAYLNHEFYQFGVK